MTQQLSWETDGEGLPYAVTPEGYTYLVRSHWGGKGYEGVEKVTNPVTRNQMREHTSASRKIKVVKTIKGKVYRNVGQPYRRAAGAKRWCEAAYKTRQGYIQAMSA